jgi:hypothetical protein
VVAEAEGMRAARGGGLIGAVVEEAEGVVFPVVLVRLC